MTNEELLKLDFQLFTERSLIYNTAQLTTLLENQSKILSLLTSRPLNDVVEETNISLMENIKRVNEEVKKKTPEYSYNK
jgi:hypothetical protein